MHTRKSREGMVAKQRKAIREKIKAAEMKRPGGGGKKKAARAAKA